MNTPAGSSSVGSPNTIRFQHGTHHDMLRRRVTDSDRGRSTSVEICAFFNERQHEGRVVGVDVSAGMLVEAERATLTSGLTNIEFVEGDASQLPRDANGAFDAVMCAAGLLYLNVPVALREWYRLLRRGGVFGFTTMRAGLPRAAPIFCGRGGAF